MVHSSTAFVSMAPYSRFPVRHLRMCALSGPDATISRLRDFQRAVSEKRNRVSRPPPPPLEGMDQGTQLAEALFPECRDEEEGVRQMKENAKQMEVIRKEVEDEKRVFEMSETEDEGISSADIARFFGIGEGAEQREAGKHGTGKNGKRKGARDGEGGVKEVAVRKMKGERRVAGGVENSSGTQHTNVGSSELECMARKSASAGIKPAVVSSTFLRDKGNQRRMLSSVAKGKRENEELRLDKEWEDGMKKEATFTVMRLNGSLPWRQGFAPVAGSGEYYPEGEFQVLDIERFTSDAGLTRGHWKLPRKKYLSGAGRNSKEENLGTERAKAARRQGYTADCRAILEGLNDLQREAVLADPERACLVLAGPGSGKTKVLTHRFAYLVRKYDVPPFNILAVTFTNKAATEMKARISALLGERFAPDWMESGPRLSVGTFHAACIRILRVYGSNIGVSSNFDICDASDSRQLVSRLLREVHKGTPDASAVRMNCDMISKLKNDREGEEGSWSKVWPKFVYKRISELRSTYDRELRSMNKLDFDDILLEARKLLTACPEVLAELHERYAHVLVDEWQDTNHVQFDLVSLLAGKRKNLFVVGDADQSIYKFRGADSGNVKRFVETFPESVSIALEHNYRSSAAIVGAAQAVIEGDSERPEKKMTTLNEFGNKVLLRETYDDRKEAHFVISTVTSMLEKGDIGSYSDVAILYRTNAQSRMIEEACVQHHIPYRLLSGTKFYDRQEVRDLVAYLKLLANPADNDSFRRVVNVPPRGIGKKTVEELENYSSHREVPLMTGLEMLVAAFKSGDTANCDVDLKRNAMSKLIQFHELYEKLQQLGTPHGVDAAGSVYGDNEEAEGGVDSLLMAIIKDVDYIEYLKRRSDNLSEEDEISEKARERVGNVTELVGAATRHSSLRRYLESVTLMERSSEEDEQEKKKKGGDTEAMSLLTLHAGKGLEFRAVFIIGAEDNTIPATQAKDEEAINEERRLLYVGMTRAKQHLTITWRAHKSIPQKGKVLPKVKSAGPSRFLNDVPKEFARRLETAATKFEREEQKQVRGGHVKIAHLAQRERRGNGANRRPSVALRAEKTERGTVSQWRVGDSVRCRQHGRGTVMTGAVGGSEGAWIEVLFTDGSQRYVHTREENVELLFTC